MNQAVHLRAALETLRPILARSTTDPVLKEIVEAQGQVFARYQPVFSPEKVKAISRDEFHEFLQFKYNHHWGGLHRQSRLICADMTRLRNGLSILVDESRPVEERLDLLGPSGRASVPYLGRAILTAVLLVTQPTKYGVWNNTRTLRSGSMLSY